MDSDFIESQNLKFVVSFQELTLLIGKLDAVLNSTKDAEIIVFEDLIRQTVHCLSLIASSTTNEIKIQMMESKSIYKIAAIAEEIVQRGLLNSSQGAGNHALGTGSDTELLRYALNFLSYLAESFPGEIVRLNCIQLGMNVTYSCKCQETRQAGLKLLASVVKGTTLSNELEGSSVVYLGLDGESKRLRHDHRGCFEKIMELSKGLVDDAGLIQFNKISLLEEGKTVLVVNHNSNSSHSLNQGFSRAHFCVIVDDCIAYARCETLHYEMVNNWKSINTFGTKAKCKQVNVTLNAMYSEVAWTALLEYIYTNCVYFHIDEISKNVDIARTIATLARYFNLPRLSAYCYEINPKSLELDLQENVISAEPGKDAWKSRWGDDMEKLLKSMKYSDIVVNVVDQSLQTRQSTRQNQSYNSRKPNKQLSNKKSMNSPSFVENFVAENQNSSGSMMGSKKKISRHFNEGVVSPANRGLYMNPPLFNSQMSSPFMYQSATSSSPMIRKSLNFGHTHSNPIVAKKNLLNLVLVGDLSNQSMETDATTTTIYSNSTLSASVSEESNETIINEDEDDSASVPENISKFDENEIVSDIVNSSFMVPQTPSKFRLGSQVPATPPHHLAMDITKSLIIEKQFVTMMKCHNSIIIPRCGFLAKALAWKQQGALYHQSSSLFNEEKYFIDENENISNISQRSYSTGSRNLMSNKKQSVEHQFNWQDESETKNLFKNKTLMNKVVQLNAPVEVASVIMRYIYYGYDSFVDTILRDDPGLALKILITANELLLEGLVHRAQHHISCYIDQDNVLPILCEVEYVNCPFLILNCIYFILQDKELESRFEYEPNLSSMTKQMIKSIDYSWKYSQSSDLFTLHHDEFVEQGNEISDGWKMQNHFQTNDISKVSVSRKSMDKF